MVLLLTSAGLCRAFRQCAFALALMGLMAASGHAQGAAAGASDAPKAAPAPAAKAETPPATPAGKPATTKSDDNPTPAADKAASKESDGGGEGPATPDAKSAKSPAAKALEGAASGPGAQLKAAQDAVTGAGEAQAEAEAAPGEPAGEQPAEAAAASDASGETPALEAQAPAADTEQDEAPVATLRSKREGEVLRQLRDWAAPAAAGARRSPTAAKRSQESLKRRVELWNSNIKVEASKASQQRDKLRAEAAGLLRLQSILPRRVRRRAVSVGEARKRIAQLEKSQQTYDGLFDTLSEAVQGAEERIEVYKAAVADAKAAGVPSDILDALGECVTEGEAMIRDLAQSSALAVRNARLVGDIVEELRLAIDSAMATAVLRRSEARLTGRSFVTAARNVRNFFGWVWAALAGRIPAGHEYSLWDEDAPAALTAEMIGILFAAVLLLAAGRRVKIRVLEAAQDAARGGPDHDRQASVWRCERWLNVLRALLTFLFALVALRLLPLRGAWHSTFLGIACACCAYRAAGALLRLVLSPREARFRAFTCDDKAARRVFRISLWLLLVSAVALPVIYALRAFDYPNKDVLYTLKLLYGVGVAGLILWLVHSDEGPLAVIAPAGTELGAKLRRWARVVNPVLSVSAVALLIISGLGYANLSFFLASGAAFTAIIIGVLWPLHRMMVGLLDEHFPMCDARQDEDDDELELAAPLNCAVHYGERIALALIGVALLLLAWRVRAYHIDSFVQYTSLPLISIKGAKVSILGLTKGLALGVASYLIARLVRRRAETSAAMVERWDRGSRYAMGAALYYVIFVGGILIAILVAGMQLTVLAAFAGMLGVAVGFGSQDIAKNTICGLIILLDRSINVGDYVDVAGQSGTITDISVRSTAIRTHDNRRVIVPNSTFYGQNVVVSSQRERRVKLVLDVMVAADSDLDKVSRLLAETALTHEGILPEPVPEVVFTKLAAAALNLQLIVWTDKIEDVTGVQGRLLRTLWETLKANEITVV